MERNPLSGTARSQRVLLIEDHADTSEAFARILESSGYAVERAATLEQAKRACAAGTFDTVLCDVELPDGSGLELPQWFREHYPGGRIIAVTAHAMPREVQGMRKAGFDLVLTKPVSIDLLLLALSNPDAIPPEPQATSDA